jgi:Flp pilus assembly pilin Flp
MKTRFKILARVLRRLPGYKDEEGVTAIEFAIVAPVLLTFLLGIIEVGMIFFNTMLIEGAITNTARLGKTGFVQEGISREQTIMNMLEERTAGMIDLDDITITATVYPGFDTIGDAEPCKVASCSASSPPGDYDDINGNGKWDSDMGVAGYGYANDVVVYTVTYNWPIMTPFMSAVFGTSTYNITARAVVKNEPYDVGVTLTEEEEEE